MSTLEIIEEFKKRNVVPRLEGGQLKLFGDTEKLEALFLDKVRAQKGELIAFLQDLHGQSEAIIIPVLPVQEHYAASGAQERLWLLSQLEGGAAAYNIITALYAKGTVVRENMENAFRLLVQRHESLRTLFIESDGSLRQVISGAGGFCPEYEDISGFANIKELLEAEVRKAANYRFSLEKELPVKVKLLRLSEREHALILSLHHIVSDGWSVAALLKEVMATYESLCRNEKQNSKPLRIHYKEYTQWLAERMDGPKGAPAQDFWKVQFENECEPLVLPYDFSRPVTQSFEGGLSRFYLPAGVHAGIAEFCRKNAVTLFNFLRSTITILLHKLSGQTEITIGTPVSGRHHYDLEEQLGLYVNTLPLRAEVDTGDSFLHFVKKISEHSMRCFEFQEYPLDRIIGGLGLRRNTGRNPLFDVVMTLQNTAVGDGRMGLEKQYGFELVQLDEYLYDGARIDRDGIPSKFDLTFNFGTDPGNRFYLEMEFAARLFRRESISQYFDAYLHIIEQVLDHPQQAIGSLATVNASARQNILGLNDHTASYPQHATITSLFEEQAAATPDNIAVAFEEKELSYKELNEKANRLAHYIRNNYTIHPDDLVAVQLERSEQMIIALLAVLKSGAAYVPIDPAYPQERIDYMISDSNCKLVIDEELLKKFYDEEERYGVDNPSTLHLSPSSLAYVIYTSGTTGKPKGSLIEHRNVVRLFKTDSPLFDFSEKDVWTVFHSFCFDFSVWEMYGALLFGGKTVVVSKAVAQDTAAYRELLLQHGVTILNQTPSAFYNLIREELEGQASGLQLRYVIFGGEALSPGRLKEWKEKYPPTKLVNMYGITETTVHVTYKEITQKEIDTNSSNIGSPIPTLTCYVLDRNQQLLPIGVSGELYVGGEGVCRGYLNRDELTAQKFIQSPFRKGERLYRTGDKAKLLENGELEYGGRIDEQVKIRGYRIELGEIEKTMERSGAIESAVVVTRTGSDGQAELVAYFTGSGTLNVTALRSWLGITLPSYMIPAYFVQLDSLPLTSNGKVNKKALPEPEGLGMNTGVEYVAPRNEVEQKLAAIWQDILGREGVGVKDNFFDLGGHSLKITRLASQIYKCFDVKPALKDLFANLVLEDQAALVAEAQKISFVAIMPAAAGASYPLSPSQRRLWLVGQLEQGNEAYNIPVAYLFEGSLDEGALAYAFNTLIGRHESLRTVFREDEQGEARQFILLPHQLSFGITRHDLRQVEEREQKLSSLVQQEFLQPFDLSAGPLLRGGLFQVSDNKWVFTFVMHHIITDGWSMTVLIKELLLLYHAHVQGKANPLPPLRIQYKDYAAWQQEQMSGGSFTHHKNYWLQQFEGELPLLELPGDRPRPAFKTYNGATVSTVIDARLTGGLRQLMQQQDSTLFMGLLSVVNALLHRYTGQQDIITGTQIAGREHADLDDQIGMYLNTLALRARFSGEDNFIQLLENIKGVTLGAYEHQAYPFDELVDALDLQRDRSRNPLFDVSVVLQNAALQSILEEQQLDGLNVISYEGVKNQISKFDLAFDFAEIGEEIQASIVYNTDIYSAHTAQQLLHHLQQLLSALLAQPSTSISRLDYLTAEEKENLLHHFNNTKVDYPSNSSIARLFEEQAARTPEAIALVFGNKELTYRGLDEQSNKLAHYLVQQYRLQPGSFAGVLIDRSEQLMIAILAILKTGAAYVPIDPEYPTARKEFIISDTSIEVLLTQTDYLFDLGYYSGDVFAVDVQLDTLETSTSSLSVNIESSDLAYVMYTSGSTGTPKGVMVEQRSVVRLVKNTNFVSFNSANVLLSTGAVSFDATTFEYWGMLLNGGTLVLCGRETLLDAQRLAEEIKNKGVNMMWFTAGWLNQLVEKNITVFDGLDTIVAGGDKLSPYHINALKLAYPSVKIINGYGPTENTTFSLTCEVPAGAERIPVGKPIHNSTAYILDALGQLVPVGVVGEICVGGDGLARGYLNNPELTEQKFIAHPLIAGARLYKTGDLGRWLPDGTIEFMGRRDEQVKIRGFRIEPGEIESVLQSHEAVEAAVVQVRTREEDKELIAYVVNKQPVSMSDLRTYLSGLLPAYMIPAHFVQLDQLPLNANGKVDRKALPDPEGSERGVEYVAPRNSIEEKLVQIWQEVLGRETISVKDNFFEIGGHSLKATRLASQLHKELEVKVELKDLFSRMILEEQAELIAQAQKTAFTAIEPIALQESYELSSSQHRIWVMSQFEEANLSYNIPGVFVFEGALDLEALNQSFTTLIERHESLRTVFRTDEIGRPRQYVRNSKECGFHIAFYDLRQDDAREERLKESIQRQITTSFRLGEGPLLRAELYQVSNNEWIFTYVMHHIISDGWSMRVLMEELMQLYNAFVTGRPNPLQPLRIQYKDYAAWQQQQLSGETLAAQGAYWQARFQGRMPVLRLSSDNPRPAVPSYKGGIVVKNIGAALARDLRAICQEEGGTLFMGLLAAVNVLLHRYTGQEDIVIGTPIANRQHADLEGQIGFYLNTLALRTKFRAAESFSALLGRVKQLTLEAYEHQSYPFDKLVDDLQLKRDLRRNALFDVMILLQNFNTADGSFEGDFENVSLKRYESGEHTVSKYDLTFYFTETGDTIRTDIEYNSDIFERDTIVKMGEYLEKVLLAITVQPTASVHGLVLTAMGGGSLPFVRPFATAEKTACSEHQKRLWFIDQFEKNYLYEGSPVYHNLPLVVKLDGAISIEDLQSAISKTVAAHDILRTAIITENSEPFQLVHGARDILLRQHRTAASAEELLQECLGLIGQPFDIAEDALVRFDLVISKENERLLIITAHHLVADRRSLRLLFKELIDRCRGTVTALDRTPYRAFTQWQNGLTESELEPLSFYWKRKLEDAPVLYLDTDQHREHVHIYKAALRSSALGNALSARIDAFCAKNGFDAFRFFLAVFNTLLYRYTGSDEIVIGALHDNCGQEELADMVGPLANLVTLKTNVCHDTDFLHLLKDVSADYEQSIEFAGLPFEKVVLDVNPGKDMSRTALFDVMIHYEQNEEELGEIELNRGLGKYDLNLLVKKEEGYGLYLTFNEKYFSASRMERFLGHFTMLVEQVLDAPGLSIKNLNCLGDAEKQILLGKPESVSYPQHATITSLFEEQAAATPDNIAVAFEEKELSYKELNEKANRLAHYIRNNYTIHPDDLVAVQLERSEKMIIALLAVLKSGAAYVPIDPAYPQERIDYMISDSNCKLVIDEEELEKFRREEERYASSNPAPLSGPSSLAYVIYTSGTTGKPKGSLIEHRNVVRLFKTDKSLFDFTEKDVWTVFHSFCFDFSVWEMYGALLFGGKTVVVSKAVAQDTAAYRELLLQQGVTILNQTPSAFYNLIREELEGEASGLQLRYVIFGGEALSPGRLKEWKEKYPATKLVNMYGITETTVHVTYKEITQKEIDTNSSNIGSPIPTLTCYVLDRNQQLLPIGVSGELYVGGEGVCRGYLNRDELTAQKFIQSPFRKGERLYRTGDKAKLLENGELEYGGRIDDQVKIRGYRIELGEIENALRRNEKIEDVVLVARKDAQGETDIIAYMVGRARLDITELRLELATGLPAYMLPAHFIQLEQLPLTSNGKVDKKNLPEPGSADTDMGVEYVAPRNAIEEKLALIWQEVLGRDMVGAKDNFFESGGHSLKATRLTSHIYKEFEVKMALKDIFTRPVLEDQAQFIEQAGRTSFDAIIALEPQEDYALSSSQRRLWVLSQFGDASAAYNMPGVFVFKGDLRPDALEQAFSLLIGRHESLRTVFVTNTKGEVRQRILSPQDTGFRIHHRDLRSEQQHQKIKALIEEEAVRPFDLSTGPLLRAGLLQVNDREWIFCFVMHHIISDAWSLDILISELLQLYNAYMEGEAAPLQPLRIQYKDYAAWQQQQLGEEGLKTHKNYWLQQFEGELPVLELPTDRPRPHIKTYNGGVVHTTIGTDISRRMKALCQGQGGTLFMGLLSAVNVLLHRYTGQEDIIIGSPIAGRQHADLEKQIGFYLNTLALRSRFNGTQNFQQLLENVKEVTMEAYEHQIYPFDELVDQLNLRRDMSRSPLFDVMVILQNAGNHRLAGRSAAGLTVEPYGDSSLSITKFDLLFNFTEQGEEIGFDLEYNSDLYDRSTAERICAHLQQLLEAITADPFASITKLDYMGAEEKHLLLTTFNDTGADYRHDTTLAALFEEQVQQHPARTALVFQNKTFTYEDLNSRANRLAFYLRKHYNLQANDTIAVQLERSEWMILSLLAVLKSGGAYLPIDPEYPQERTDYIVADSGCKLVINEEELARFREEEHSYHSTNPAPLNRSTDLAYVIYTSGSTGKPKGCMLEHRGVINRIGWMHDHYGYTSEDIILQKTTFTFDVSVWELFLPLCWGMKMVLCHKDDVAAPERIATLIEEQKVTCLHFVPGMLNAFIAALFDEENMAERLKSLRLVVTSGEALTPATVQGWYKKLSTPLHNLYGPTEASIDVAWYAANAEDPIIPIGRPIRNTQMYVLDSHQALVPLGVSGEICIAGDGLARGYLNKPELTQEKFIAHPFKAGARIYRTGDWGRWLPDGNIEYLGRMDDQVKVRGYRIELGEIENALQSHSAIDAAVVVARSDKQGEKELVAYIVSSASINITELRLHLGRTLPAYMVPAYFVQLEVLPLTSSGKVNRKALPAPEGLGMGSGVDYVAPSNETEEKLAIIWQEILGREKIGVNDSFFDLGGHSLKALQLVAQIQKDFGINVNVKDVFLNPTIQTVSNIIKAGKWVESSKNSRRENRNIVEV